MHIYDATAKIGKVEKSGIFFLTREPTRLREPEEKQGITAAKNVSICLGLSHALLLFYHSFFYTPVQMFART